LTHVKEQIGSFIRLSGSSTPYTLDAEDCPGVFPDHPVFHAALTARLVFELQPFLGMSSLIP